MTRRSLIELIRIAENVSAAGMGVSSTAVAGSGVSVPSQKAKRTDGDKKRSNRRKKKNA